MFGHETRSTHFCQIAVRCLLTSICCHSFLHAALWQKAVALFPTINSSTYLSVTNTTIPCRVVTSGCKGSNSPGAESPWGRRMTAGGAEDIQQCHKYFLQYSQFASIRLQIQIWGSQSCFLPRAPSNLVTPLGIMQICSAVTGCTAGA